MAAEVLFRPRATLLGLHCRVACRRSMGMLPVSLGGKESSLAGMMPAVCLQQSVLVVNC